MANIQYIGNDTSKSERGKVHKNEGNFTGCGAKISDNRKDWVTTVNL